MSKEGFKICPYCGYKIKAEGDVIPCPNCGKEIAAFTEVMAEISEDFKDGIVLID